MWLQLTVPVSCFWGCEAASWVDSRPIVSVSCAEQGQGEMTLVWQWYGTVQCKVWVQGYYQMAPNTNCTMKLTRLWYTWHSVCPRMCSSWYHIHPLLQYSLLKNKVYSCGCGFLFRMFKVVILRPYLTLWEHRPVVHNMTTHLYTHWKGKELVEITGDY